MDALSDVLPFVDLTGGVFMDAEFTEPWSVSGKVAPGLLFQLTSSSRNT
jgi:hypothetical protein